MSKFTIFVNTPGTAYSGCDEILQVIEACNMDAAIAWSRLWCGYEDVTRICGEDQEWFSDANHLPVTDALLSQALSNPCVTYEDCEALFSSVCNHAEYGHASPWLDVILSKQREIVAGGG